MGLGAIASKYLLEPFVKKPGLHLPAGTTARDLTVEETVGGKPVVDHFIQSDKAAPAKSKTGAVLTMTPKVDGGFKEGDIVLRGNSIVTTAQSGLVETLRGFFETGHWKLQKSEVSHSGIVVRRADGTLGVVHMVSGSPPAELAKHLSWFQKKTKTTFLREESLDAFFNIPGTPITQATVMRHGDAAVASKAAKKALDYFNTQVTDAKEQPWYSKLPHSWSPNNRGGVCSTFDDLAFDERFQSRHHLPTTPHTFAISPELEMVGDRSITAIEAATPKTAVKRTA
jgi:hypothetical protein